VKFLAKTRQVLTALVLVLVMTTVAACGGGSGVDTTAQLPRTADTAVYPALQQGNTTAGQNYGSWVTQTANGLVQDAYVRDNNKLGVVISPKVRPNEVRPLARSLVEGFHKSFPGQDLTVLMYAPDKQLIMTAEYDNQSNQITYNVA